MAHCSVSGVAELSATHWGVNQLLGFREGNKVTMHGYSCSFQFVTKEEENFRYYEYHFQNKM